MQTTITRMVSETPKWFQKIRNIGLILTAIGTAIVSVPVSLPAILVTLASYCIVGGAVAAAVAQSATTTDTK